MDPEQNLSAEQRFEVGREHHRLSLFDVLDALAGPLDRKAVRTAARERRVLLNAEPVSVSQTVRSGDLVEILAPLDALRQRHEPSLPVLLHEPPLLVAAKESGMPFDAGRVGRGHSVLERLQDGPLQGSRPVALHRLDKDTSGLVLVATSREAGRPLLDDLAAGRAWIEYLAVVRGAPAAASGTIDSPLGKRRRSDQALVVTTHGGTEAHTEYEVTERLRGFSVLRVRPRGGRSHQVRAHLAHLGHPVLCDALYGEDDRLLLSQLKLDYRKKRGRPERPLLARPALHAHHAELGGRRLEAPLPKDLDVLLATLRRLFGSSSRPEPPDAPAID